MSAKERRKLCRSAEKRAFQVPCAASCQALFLCCFGKCSLHFPEKWSADKQFLRSMPVLRDHWPHIDLAA